MKPVGEIVDDFDAIAAALEAAGPSRELTDAERALLAYVPPGARTAADVGCGDGGMARALAARGLSVLATDVSPRMIALGQARTPPNLAVEYRVADIMTEPLPSRAYDVVMSVNVVHHVALAEIVPRLADAVAPGGSLLIQDVTSRPGARYAVVNVAASFRVAARRLLALERRPKDVAALYDRHGRDEIYLTPDAVASAYAALLPDARVELHLEWRYSVIWTRPLR